MTIWVGASFWGCGGGFKAVGFGVVSGRSSPLGEGDHAKHGGGACEVFPALSASQDSARAPPPPYGWSPSPCRGGPATIGRFQTFIWQIGRASCRERVCQYV